ncbi:MAG: MATE family efflux transporter [Vicinamibacteraceae bacterium]
MSSSFPEPIVDRAIDAPPSERSWRSGLVAELRPTLHLAWPVIAGEIGWMAMSVVDTVMVSPLGPAAIGAVGVGSNSFMAVAIFGMGLLLGLDTVVSRAFGARRLDECHRWLLHGVVLAVLVSVPLALVGWTMPVLLARMRVHPDVLPMATEYLRILDVGLLPLLMYAAFRRYLQGLSLTRPVGFALVSANLVNVVVNWLLIYGHLGLPAMGVAGSAWATLLSRVYMAAVLGVAIVRAERAAPSGLWQTPRHIDLARLQRLVALGLPAAVQLVLEIGVFAAITVLAGKLAPTSLAAHHIALNLAALVFMVPLGMASAAAVRVGQALGRGDLSGAAHRGWAAIALVVLFLLVSSVLFASVPRFLVSLFTSEAAVVAAGVVLLRVYALYQVFDGIQVTATGALRGLGDTRTPLVYNLVAHWGVGLPVGYVLCFQAGAGVVGLWIGLGLGLTAVAVALLVVWRRQVRRHSTSGGP